MLSEKIKTFCKEKGWWNDDYTQEYADALRKLNIDLTTDFATFFLHVEDSPTFYGRHQELYQICWFAINTNYELAITFAHDTLELPNEYIPLDSFEGEGGFFYNRSTGAVLEIELGQKLIDFQKGELQPQWHDFNSFVEWFFEIP
ncbi:MAG: hypothetical protein D8H98_14605 [Prevotella sp.]|nr:MAG: hypothetical protein D8H98_14605 [Prevotella sp.]